MTTVAAIHSTGIGVTTAAFEDGVLAFVSCAEFAGDSTRADRGRNLASAMAEKFRGRFVAEVVAVEMPRSFSALTVAQHNDSVSIAFALGSVAQAIGGQRTVLVAPWAWRGERSDSAVRRLVASLDAGELAAYQRTADRIPLANHLHLLSAIGVGFYAIGREW